MRVVGHDMAPRFRDGDFVYVDPDEPAVDGRFVAVRDPETETTQVRLYSVEKGRRLVHALDSDVSVRMLTRDNETDLCGVVVFVGSKV